LFEREQNEYDLLVKKSFSFDIVNLLKNVLETQIVATKIQVLSVYYLIGV
jgi:hypothetical protein